MKEHALYLLRAAVVAAYPFLLSKYTKWPPNNRFKLADLSKVLALLVGLNALGLLLWYGLTMYSRLGLTGYRWFSELRGIVLTTASITIILRYTPFRNDKESLLIFPIIKKNSLRFLLVISTLLLSVLAAYLRITDDPGRLWRDATEAYETFHNPCRSVLLFLPIELYVVIGEELVFRYFAVNALQSVFGNRMTVIISSAMWMLMHQAINPGIMMIGIILATLFIWTGSLSICIFIHFVLNQVISTGPLYVYLARMRYISISPEQYAMGLIAVIFSLYFALELVSRKKAKRVGAKEEVS